MEAVLNAISDDRMSGVIPALGSNYVLSVS
jgi:hypothetical protein